MAQLREEFEGANIEMQPSASKGDLDLQMLALGVWGLGGLGFSRFVLGLFPGGFGCLGFRGNGFKF
eukprot:COSAG02_NODE_5139_length_4595_cov_5.334075_2_plen_66_part_00